MTEGGDEKTIKGILTKLGLIMGFILIVPGIMLNVLEIDPTNGCIKVDPKDYVKYGVSAENPCWKAIDQTALMDEKLKKDKITTAKIAFDRDVIGLISWALTAFVLIMVIVGFVFPGRDIIAYVRTNKEFGAV